MEEERRLSLIPPPGETTTTLVKEKQIYNSLYNREYREALAVENVNTTLAIQIRKMRENRPWSQSELAQHLNKHQETISQWENPDYGRYSLTTLKELAKVFDVALLVKFVPFSEFVKDMVNLSEKSLSPPSFSDDHPQFTMPNSWVAGLSISINANSSFFFGWTGQAAQGKFPQTTSAREFLPPNSPSINTAESKELQHA